MSETALAYLRDVLGMEWLPLKSFESTPTKVQHAVKSTEAATDSKSKILVVVSQPFTPSDQALLGRMMQAIQVTEYTVSHEFCERPGVALLLDPGVAEIKGMKAHGDVMLIGERKTIYSHCLSDLREGPAPLVQQRKKIAWSHLQTMQSWLGTEPG